MRATLSLDDDVVSLLARVRQTRKLSLKEAVNEALRQGLREMTRPEQAREPYQTPSSSLGRCLVGNIDDIAEVLPVAEGKAYR